jgi:hypothetical protein
MQTAAPTFRAPAEHDDAIDLPSDIFSRMSDVELLAELRCIRALATRRSDAVTAAQAGDFFASFYAHRTQSYVPAWLWDATRAFVRHHAR